MVYRIQRKRRWSDNDRHFGIFTYAHDYHANAGIILDTGGEEYPGLSLRAHLLGHTLIIELPQIIKPYKEWVDLTGTEWATTNGYYDIHPREYGFRWNDGFLQIFFGPQTHSSLTTKDWCKHIPWQNWRFYRFSLYALDGNRIWTELDKDRKRGIKGYDKQMLMQDRCPKIVFTFKDYDGEVIDATCHVEEREWRFGEGWFKWLSLFRNPMVKKSLSIDFSSEVGPKKGSWKGGTLGHGINMLDGELPEDAFKRYCDENNLTFLHVKPAAIPHESTDKR